MRYKFCPICGNELQKHSIPDEGLVSFCEVCSKPYFMSSGISVLVVLINEQNEIVLTKQRHIAEDKWILISGYLKQGEDIEETVNREVKEETGLDVTRQIYISSYYHDESDLLILGFAAYVNKKEFVGSQEIDEIGWFVIDEAVQAIWKGSIAEKLLLKTIETLKI